MFVCVWIVTGYLLFEKETLIGLLKVIGIQNQLLCFLRYVFEFNQSIYKIYEQWTLKIDISKLIIGYSLNKKYLFVKKIWKPVAIKPFFKFWFKYSREFNNYLKILFPLEPGESSS